ncbi:MAG: HlyD family efflux transporter periplasmic adaptor subunit [Candidatus Dormibacteraceae bacterium]
MEVTAPIAGTVDQVFVSTGSFVPTTSAVAEMVPSAAPLRGLVFVPADQGESIHSGMQVSVSPTTAPAADYGSIRGTVLSVESFPIGSHRISLLVGNRPSLASGIQALGPAFEVVVELRRDPSTSSGYAWTSGLGPSYAIPAGTLLNATITISDHRPLKVAF